MVVPVVQDDMFRRERIGGQVADVGKKKADLVELNRMDQDSERMVPVVQNDTCRKEQSCTATPPVINMKPASQPAALVLNCSLRSWYNFPILTIFHNLNQIS